MADETSEPKKAPAKKPAAKKAAADKAEAPKAAAKKAPAKKAAADKAEAPKAAAKKPAADKAEAPKAAAKKPAASKAKTAKAEETVEKVATLKMHHLRPAEGAHTKKTRVGRGEASKGKTAGRGTKGTGARYQVPERFEGGQTPLHMRIPKLRGFKSPFKIQYQVVNVSQIAELFPKGGEISKADLVAKGAVRKNQPVKVLGDGDIAVKVTLVDADKVSESAKAKIEAAGGSVAQG
ncbi:50S ribosomal protein L15 [Demequina zhanjiangensis]|uniref:Large ribosomal subunit protein uL15 n=1 Tax=Demequina zhanjiangensis TaxID=3051659 RepID=A0ABT8FXA2_9MICO|nr:50S ribosomal protein L15 [Demequina sp. SYSU T00b26]MDN4471525.1 50S ribosomal protein L15 [Demequina sp. SYSU T00b26]